MIVAGFGFRNAATVESFKDALARAGSDVTHIATLDEKAKIGAFRAFARSTGLTVIEIPSEAVQGVKTPTQSQASLDAKGVGSVAEATAILAVGPGGALIKRRCVSSDEMATCAIAKGADG